MLNAEITKMVEEKTNESHLAYLLLLKHMAENAINFMVENAKSEVVLVDDETYQQRFYYKLKCEVPEEFQPNFEFTTKSKNAQKIVELLNES